MSWRDTVYEKMNELERIATWASITNLGSVRDSCREAKYYLSKEIERLDDNEKETNSTRDSVERENKEETSS